MPRKNGLTLTSLAKLFSVHSKVQLDYLILKVVFHISLYKCAINFLHGMLINEKETMRANMGMNDMILVGNQKKCYHTEHGFGTLQTQ